MSAPDQDAVERGDRPPTLLVATDGSDPAVHAAERAVVLAKGLGAKLFILNAIDPHELFRAGIHRGEVEGKAVRRGNEATGEIAALAEQRGVDHEQLIVEGHPASVILAAADEVGAHYVFMGAEGMSRAGRAIVGSVSQDVLRSAERPVILLVGGGRPPDDPVRRRVEQEQRASPGPEQPPR